MQNAEARSELREMLEYQIREKERQRANNTDFNPRERLYQGSVIM